MATRSLHQPSSRLQTSHVEGIIPYVLMASVHDAVYSQSTETSCLRFSTTAAVVFLFIPGAGTAGIFCFYHSICWWYNCCCCNQGTDEESLHWDDKNMGDTTESGVHRAYLQKGECHGFEAKNSKVAPNFTFLILLSLGSATFYTASFQWVGWKVPKIRRKCLFDPPSYCIDVATRSCKNRVIYLASTLPNSKWG